MDAYDMSDEELEKAFLAAKQEVDTEENSEPVVEEPTAELDDQDNLVEGSDHDGVEAEAEDDADVTSDVVDTDGDPTDEQTTEVEDDTEAETQPAQKYTYKANGKEYEFTQEEIMQRFPQVFGQAMDYTRKMQAIKPYRKTIDALEQAKVSHEDVSMMIDALKGDKAAIAALMKRTGVDALDLDSDEGSKYVPNNYGRDESTLALKDVVDEISKDQEYAITHRVLSSEWDQKSWDSMSQNPQMIKALHADVKSGVFAKVQAIAEKYKLYSGDTTKSDLDYYGMAAKEYYGNLAQEKAAAERASAMQIQREAQAQKVQKVEQVKQQEVKRVATAQAAAKRKAAAPTNTGVSKPQGVTDYLDDSDEAFDEWYKNLKDNQ